MKYIPKKNEKEAEKAPEPFECEFCDFKSKWKNGLKIHIARKHSNIKQLDGITDENESILDDKYSGTKHYWERGKLGSAYQTFLDANYLIENSDLSEDEKKEEKNKILEERKAAFGKLFKHYPPWSA